MLKNTELKYFRHSFVTYFDCKNLFIWKKNLKKLQKIVMHKREKAPLRAKV